MELAQAIGADVAAPAATRAAGRLLALERAGDLRIVRAAGDLDAALADDMLAAVVHLEGAEAIDPGLEALDTWYAAGLRSLGPVWSRPNAFGHGVPFISPSSPDTGPGLTAAGRALVQRCSDLGVLVDLSHVSADTMRHAIEVSEAPVIFSHSSARALCGVPRNVPDDVLEQVRDSGGVVMVTFVPMFLVPEGEPMSAAAQVEAERLEAEHPDDPDAVHAAMDAWFDAHPMPAASVSDVADHVDHVREVAGIDHVGIGSDFDGSPGMPEGLDDVAAYPNLFAELLGRGYADDDLTRIARGNILRVMREAERTAERLRRERPPSLARLGDDGGVAPVPEEEQPAGGEDRAGRVSGA
jgi:membrane dipeptidase